MLRRQPLPRILRETVLVARAAFPNGNPYLRLAEGLSALFTDETFGALFPTHGQPAFSPWAWRW